MAFQHQITFMFVAVCLFIGIQDESLPLLSVIDAVFSECDGLRVATRFIILIAGSVALVGR